MRGGGAKPQQQYSFRGEGVSTPELKADTVEISAKDKIEAPQKKGMSTGAKWALGILGGAAAIYGCIVGHRALTKPSLEKVAQNFSEIFRRDVSKDEALKLTKQYKEIFKIKDKDEFCKKVFEQIKKDYGYEKSNIPLLFENFGARREDGNIVLGHWNPFHGNIALNTENLKQYGEKLKKSEQQDITNILLHEFQHVKQGEYAYRTNADRYLNRICSDKRAYELALYFLENEKEQAINVFFNVKEYNFKTRKEVESFIDKAILQLKNNTYKSDNRIMDLIKSVKNDRHKFPKSNFGQFEKFKQNSEEYKKGLNYLDCYKTYNNTNMEIYDDAIVEKEAFATADKIANLYNYMTSIWHI